ncbi:aspartate ammonia-lyase [Boudabousia liubingyangii]|uniref:Aspartate ammonia-lyase n=1 Tax=Boudabousia liubingyangii TaxID=1921764 RepID=A0A1Q5PKM9_9ACTO|nr:aspartate ammonia-lyase [Boudabousia liubingyangii]OKL47180.1 aspartate ammonia-lyase [Boudabousia liubingyangii]
MSETRTEEDLLGAREIPADAYWGIHTLRAIENYQISGMTLNDFPEMIRAMVQVKKACALANGDLGTMRKWRVDAIVAACDAILDHGLCMDQFPIDLFQGGAGTSVNMNTNEVIANLALEMLGRPRGDYQVIDPNDHVNRSQSTNDTFPTGLCLATFASVSTFRVELARLADAFAEKGLEFRNVLKMGRTQLQDAVPMTLGQEMAAFAINLAEEDARLENNASLLLETNLGATAIGTALNTPPGYAARVVERLAEVTGSPVVGAANLIEATQDTGQYVSMHGTLKRTAVKLSKICNDLRLLGSGPRAGLAELRLPQRAAGSSIMPAKVNPVIPEVVNQVCFKVFGNDITVTMAAQAGQLQLNVMEPVIMQSLYESLRLLTNACRTLREYCVEGLEANEERCKEYVMNSIGIITYFNDIIGHHNGDLIGKEAAATGRQVRDLVIEKGLLAEEQVDKILSPENLAVPVYSGPVEIPVDEDQVPEEFAPIVPIPDYGF